MIFGTGTDIIETDRIQKAIEKTPGFAGKIFTEAEQKYCEARKAGKYQSYAARYAAKEAFFKALGTGYRDGMRFREIEIINDPLGKPEIRVHGKVKTFVSEQKIIRTHLSLSHLREMAVAFVILEKK
ncbi:holo-ACP synthase [Candidatus Sulfidibacterium hydrothermale]|uniref:holo-ACP synthase n=1 Tax=Candidatus Sulfidibacterium hydrothermale TaxID=2875962 RepID=UPI001F0A335B|nr:holo-ACP synthase [Candidatus Sulfidibacterium hydrothermale]UBM62315.1 holo-ACP synthase [Candidatus Sulfidibacterium hydrothermale]